MLQKGDDDEDVDDSDSDCEESHDDWSMIFDKDYQRIQHELRAVILIKKIDWEAFDCGGSLLQSQRRFRQNYCK